jgi:SSS family solute:Na+ symporter
LAVTPFMLSIQLQWLDYLILAIYVTFVLGIGWTLARFMKTSSDFLTSGRSIPTWVTGLAFISANLGALELVGMAASGAKYGMTTCFFYWAGCDSSDDFLRRVHDAVLLRFQCAFRPGIFEDAF